MIRQKKGGSSYQQQ